MTDCRCVLNLVICMWWQTPVSESIYNEQAYWMFLEMISTGQAGTVKDNPQLSDLKGHGTSKLDWRCFEHKVDRNELQVRKNLHKGTGTKMTKKLNNLTEKNRCLYANFCKSGVHSYQLYCIQSTFSPILKSLVPWGHLG